MTNPGQTTPWAKIPIPSEGKLPDVPVDMAALADVVDTVLANVIGGSSAPSGPLSPSLVDASASIGSLNSTQSAQQSQISTMQSQITALSAAPWAVATSRTTAFSMPGVRVPTLVHSYQVPSFTERRLLIAFATISLGWSGTSITTSIRSRLQIRADGATDYVDRNIFVATGDDQGHNLHFIETIEAGKSVRVGLSVDSYGATQSSATIVTQSLDPRMYLVALPWTGPTVPYLPTLA